MRILITNDDGIHAPGLKILSESISQFGEVVVVAPDRERSACSHGMTMTEPLRVYEQKWKFCRAYSVTGLPVDCINVGLTLPILDSCDLILSGLNSGPNLGFDITYSGTVAGAMEGIINGIRSISLSMAAFGDKEHFFESGAIWLADHFNWITKVSLPSRTFLNVNFPSLPYGEYQGMKFVKMGGRVYRERLEERIDPWGKPYYWQGGLEVEGKPEPKTDFEAILGGYVAITPISLDWTQNDALRDLQSDSQKVGFQ